MGMNDTMKQTQVAEEQLTKDDAMSLLSRILNPESGCPFHGELTFRIVAGRAVDIEVTRNVRRKKEALVAIT